MTDQSKPNIDHAARLEEALKADGFIPTDRTGTITQRPAVRPAETNLQPAPTEDTQVVITTTMITEALNQLLTNASAVAAQAAQLSRSITGEGTTTPRVEPYKGKLLLAGFAHQIGLTAAAIRDAQTDLDRIRKMVK